MTSVAFITDQHFDVTRRFEETVRVHRWIAEDIAKRKPDVTLLGGDLFERRSVPDDRNAAEQWILSLAKTAPVVGVYGNHCSAGDLDVFNDLESPHPITFYSRPALHRLSSGLNIACLPWPRKAVLNAASNKDISSELLNEMATDLLRNVLRGLGMEAKAAGDQTIFLGHVMTDGAQVREGQPLMPGMEFSLGLDDLGLVDAQAYCLGHIHYADGNRWTINGAPCFYGGSSTRKTYGEAHAKYYHIVTLDESGAATVEPIPTPCTPMLLLEAKFSVEHGCVWIANESLPVESMSPPGIAALAKGADIRVRFETASAEREAAKLAAKDIERRLLEAGAVAVKTEERVIQITHARAPEIVETLNIKDQLRILWDTQSDVPPADQQARLFEKLSTLEVEAHNA